MPLPERTTQHYGPGVTAASLAVLLELMTVLRSYRDALVLVGGWMPYFLLTRHRRPEDPFVHIGSIDIDLAVDPATVQEPQYATIVELLTERGYQPAQTRRGAALASSFERQVASPLTHKPYTIRVDFLTHDPSGQARPRAPQPVQDDLLARKIHGCEAAFRYQTTTSVSGTLPEGGTLTVPIRLADVTACLAMKGIVLGERYREKDAYDLYAVIAHYQRGPASVADAVRPHLGDPLVAEGVGRLQEAFRTREAHGPAWVAAFLTSPVFAAERQRIITDAFMVVNEFLRLLSQSPAVPAP